MDSILSSDRVLNHLAFCHVVPYHSRIILSIDNKAPELVLTTRPERSSSTPKFEWRSSEDVTFECSLDDDDFAWCGNGTTGSWKMNDVGDGRHKFSVRGKDINGNTGTHTHTWVIGNR